VGAKRPFWDYVFNLNYGVVDDFSIEGNVLKIKIIAANRALRKIIGEGRGNGAVDVDIVLVNPFFEFLGEGKKIFDNVAMEPFSYDEIEVFSDENGGGLSIHGDSGGVVIKADGVYWKL